MIKYAQIVFLVSSDRDLNDALFDQFQLVDSFKFHILNWFISPKTISHI